MNPVFKHHEIVDTIARQGYPKDENDRRKLLRDLGRWQERAFENDDMLIAASRVGQRLFRTVDGLAAQYIAYRLEQENPRAFLDFMALVIDEYRTRELETIELANQASKNLAHAKEVAEERRRTEATLRHFTREEFYELVWSEPATEIAKRFALSDVMIAKLCRKHHIPKPYAGYWAEYYAGKKPKRRKLAPLAEQVIITLRLRAAPAST